MLGFRLKEFIDRLRVSPDLAEYDRTFLTSFDNEFPTLNPHDVLNARQLTWLEQAFSSRWQAIIHLVFEQYSFNQDGNNKYWIQFAKDLAPFVDKTFIQILMPSVKNTQDPNNLARLEECELDDLFLSEDGTTLYIIHGIFANFQKGFFYTFLNIESGKYVQRPLSLGEWAMIRLKTQSRPINVNAISYARSWDFIAGMVQPRLAESTELYQPILSSILGFIEIFYREKHNPRLKEKLKNQLFVLSKQLMGCSIEEVNCLYGQKINMGQKVVYLLDILIDCWQMEMALLNEQLLSLARWLAELDASLVLRGLDELEEVYQGLHVSAAFTVSDLNIFLSHMSDTCLVEISKEISLLQNELQGKEKIDADVIAALIKIFRMRWNLVIDTPEDYLRSQQGINASWIRLAQLLKGAGYFEQSYYLLLMPTLVTDIDPVTLGPISEIPLSHCVLSTDRKSLIYLGNCEEYLKAYGTFSRCTSNRLEAHSVSPLSEVEISRMQFANARYQRYILVAKGVNVEEEPIAKSTVLAVYELVNNSLFANGLLFAHDYDTKQKEEAGKAYHVFYNFLRDLAKTSKTEKDRLYAQKIQWLGKNVTFKSVLDDVERDECIAVCGSYFAKMVMDYAPYLKFRPEVEQKARISAMRTNSQLKVYSDYNKINHNEAKRRIQILAASLMSTNFQYKLSGESLSIWDCCNTIGHVLKDIYRLIAPMIRSGNYRNARYVYAKVIETMVKPALPQREQSWFNWFTRSEVIGNWLADINNQTMFTRKTAWYKPEFLLVTLLPVPSVDARTHVLLEEFIEEIAHTYAQSQNTALKEIRVNIKFTQLLHSLDDTQRRFIFKKLDTVNREVDVREFNEVYANYIIRRLVSSMIKTAGANQKFFASISDELNRRGKIVRDTLLEAVNAEDRSPLSIFERLTVKINRMPLSVCKDTEKTTMKEYLTHLRNPIVFLSTPQTENYASSRTASPEKALTAS